VAKRIGPKKTKHEVTSRIEGDKVSVEAVGDFDSWTANELRAALRQAVDQTPKQIDLRLADVTFFGSAAVAALIECFKRVGTYGGKLKLVDVNDYVSNVIRIVHLEHEFDID